MKRKKEIKKAVLFTINYFDLFDYPPSHQQIHKYLYQKKGYIKETNQALFELKKEGKIKKKGKYWFLPKREGLIKKRKEKEKASKKLRKKLYYWGWLFKIVPFVRGVFIVNNLAFGNAQKTSDIDLLIISKRNRLWVARFFSTLLANLTGQRVMSHNGDPGKFCLSFYLSEDNLDLRRADGGQELIFRKFWFALIRPLYPGGVYSRFLADNSWALKSFPNLTIKSGAPRAYARGTSPRASSGETLRSVSSFAKATEDTLIHPRLHRRGFLRSPTLAEEGKRRAKKALSLPAFLLEKVVDLFPGLNDYLFTWQKRKIKSNLPTSYPPKEVIIKKRIFKSHFDNSKKEINKKLKKLNKV